MLLLLLLLPLGGDQEGSPSIDRSIERASERRQRLAAPNAGELEGNDDAGPQRGLRARLSCPCCGVGWELGSEVRGEEATAATDANGLNTSLPDPNKYRMGGQPQQAPSQLLDSIDTMHAFPIDRRGVRGAGKDREVSSGEGGKRSGRVLVLSWAVLLSLHPPDRARVDPDRPDA